MSATALPSPLRLPLFRALWLASIISNIGSTMNDTAAIWTMATLTSSPLMISLMQTMSSLPLFLLALPAGALAWGRVTTDFGSTPALCTAAVWLLGCAALDRWVPISHVETLDLSPSGHWQGHNVANEPAPEDGPVLITVDYHIDPAQARDFRHAMRALRETRLRDGAFRCSLFHDLDNPTHFRETFLVGSWAEHLRQHTRATIEDQRIEEAVVAFHKGPERPRVRHYLMTNLRD